MAAESDPRRREERERRLAARAERQHGVVGRDQILGLDFSRHTLQRWLDGGRLVRVHPNVYALGGRRLTQHGRWFAALLATRPDPALSHRSSLAKMGLAREGRSIHVTVANRRAFNLKGVVVHRCRAIHPDDTARVDGIPLTSLPRTLLDVAETEGARFVAKVLEEAGRREILDPAAIHACAERNPGRRGLAILLPLVAEYVPTPGAKEGLEREFQLFLRERGLPLPLVNVVVDGCLVDCWWPDAKLVVELDSRGWHGTWAARERDIGRDGKHLVAGRRPMRVTSRMVRREPDALEADLRTLLELE